MNNPRYEPKIELPSKCINVTEYHGNEKATASRFRQWTDIDTIVLHHTACLLGPKPERWFGVSCHVWSCQDGSAGLNYDPRARVWHSHSINGRSLGIEIDGNHRGQESMPNSLWSGGGGPHELTPEQIVASKAILKWMVDEVLINGGKVTQVVSHRQCSDQRDSDPGELIWNALGPYCETELGLEVNCAKTYGSGGRIPCSWDNLSFWSWPAWVKSMDSDGVKLMQSLLNHVLEANLVVDGISGPATSQAVKDYQKLRGLDPDGIVGPNTYRVMRRDMHGQQG